MEKDNVEDKEGASASQLFLVRFWPDNSGKDGRIEGNEEDRVYGKVQHVLSGEAASFDDWPALMDVLKEMMHHPAQQQPRTRTHKSN